jgi:hypothetical protein
MVEYLCRKCHPELNRAPASPKKEKDDAPLPPSGLGQYVG